MTALAVLVLVLAASAFLDVVFRGLGIAREAARWTRRHLKREYTEQVREEFDLRQEWWDRHVHGALAVANLERVNGGLVARGLLRDVERTL